MLLSPLPSDILYIILRMVPSVSYLTAYAIPDPPLFDCERCFEDASFSDLHAPKPYGFYWQMVDCGLMKNVKLMQVVYITFDFL